MIEPARADGKPAVTLVIPGRNCGSTLDRCLSSVVPLKEAGQLAEIIFVDDGSTDDTADIAARYPVTVLTGKGEGPGAARNLGWQAAKADLIWFIDSDCVAEPNALAKLLPHIDDPKVAGVGGSYANLFPDNLLATLIHEEIVARHRGMPRETDFLATFNVVYRWSVLEEMQGFSESLKLAQDAELAFRISEARHKLHFEIDSKVGHHHPIKLWRYLRTQARQGYYRMALYRRHPGKIKGDSYAGFVDYVQPPLAVLLLASLPLVFLARTNLAWLSWTPLMLFVALCVATISMACRMLGNTEQFLLSVLYPIFSGTRAMARGLGMVAGLVVANDNSLPLLQSSASRRNRNFTGVTSTGSRST